MSSNRFPGKILAPFKDKPMIKHLIDNVSLISNKNKVVVLTTTEETDDPLVAYLQQIGCAYFRGSLNNVFERFQECIKIYPCDYFVRVCADSPFLNKNLIEFLLSYVKDFKYDVISNVFTRTFPKGQSVEIVKSSTFLKIKKKQLTVNECEHVLPYFYSNPQEFKTLFFNSVENLGNINMCVDTIEDYKLLEVSDYIYSFNMEQLCMVPQ